MDILSGLTSILGGGITGLIGSIANNVYAFKLKKLDIELETQKAMNEIELRKLDNASMELEWKARTTIADITATADVDKADAAALAESYKLEPQQYSEKTLLTHSQNWVMVLLDALRAVIRPGLTIYLAILTTLIYLQVRAMLGQSVPADQASSILVKIIDTVLYLTVTVVSWWFGSRAGGKKKSN